MCIWRLDTPQTKSSPHTSLDFWLYGLSNSISILEDLQFRKISARFECKISVRFRRQQWIREAGAMNRVSKEPGTIRMVLPIVVMNMLLLNDEKHNKIMIDVIVENKTRTFAELHFNNGTTAEIEKQEHEIVRRSKLQQLVSFEKHVNSLTLCEEKVGKQNDVCPKPSATPIRTYLLIHMSTTSYLYVLIEFTNSRITIRCFFLLAMNDYNIYKVCLRYLFRLHYLFRKRVI